MPHRPLFNKEDDRSRTNVKHISLKIVHLLDFVKSAFWKLLLLEMDLWIAFQTENDTLGLYQDENTNQPTNFLNTKNILLVIILRDFLWWSYTIIHWWYVVDGYIMITNNVNQMQIVPKGMTRSGQLPHSISIYKVFSKYQAVTYQLCIKWVNWGLLQLNYLRRISI